MADTTERTAPHEPPETLLARSAGGDLGAFGVLLESQREFSFRVARGLLHDHDDAEDAVQEAFIRVWKNLHTFRHEMKFTTWLYRIVVNAAYDRIRSRSRRQRWFGYLGLGEGDPPGGDDPSAGLERREIREEVIRLAKRLPPRQYLVFHLRDLLDLSVEETAAGAGMSENSVKVNLCLARKKIRAGLERMREIER